MNIVRFRMSSKEIKDDGWNTGKYEYYCPIIYKNDIYSAAEGFNDNEFLVYVQFGRGYRHFAGLLKMRKKDVFFDDNINKEKKLDDYSKLLCDLGATYIGETSEIETNNAKKTVYHDAGEVVEGKILKYFVFKFEKGVLKRLYNILDNAKHSYKEFNNKNKALVDLVAKKIGILEKNSFSPSLKETLIRYSIRKFISSKYYLRPLFEEFTILIEKNKLIISNDSAHSKELHFDSFGVSPLSSFDQVCKLGFCIFSLLDDSVISIASNNSVLKNKRETVMNVKATTDIYCRKLYDGNTSYSLLYDAAFEIKAFCTVEKDSTNVLSWSD